MRKCKPVPQFRCQHGTGGPPPAEPNAGYPRTPGTLDPILDHGRQHHIHDGLNLVRHAIEVKEKFRHGPGPAEGFEGHGCGGSGHGHKTGFLKFCRHACAFGSEPIQIGLKQIHVHDARKEAVSESLPALIEDDVVIFDAHDLFLVHLPQGVFIKIDTGNQHFG